MTTKQQQQHVSRFLEAPFVRMHSHATGELNKICFVITKCFFCFFRQLEHDSKILDFGKDDDDDTTVQTATTKKPETGNSNQTTPAANTSNTTKNTPTSKPPKEKDAKESGGKKI